MMNELQKSVVIALAENDMSVDRTHTAMHYHRNTLQYHISQIRKQTGLNPRNFFDLVRLYAMAKEESEMMKKMTLEQAIKYLQPIADNAQLCNYQEALKIAMDSMREVEKLRKELEEARSVIQMIKGDVEQC